MTLAHRRQKQPELVRKELLDVTLQILVDEGPHAVTLDAVSKRAGVTKGGLQHHFRSKQALLDALCDQLFEEFHQRYELALLAEPDGPGRHARAYVRLSFDSGNDHEQVRTQRAIALLALTWPPCRERWSAVVTAAIAADGVDEDLANRLLLCRLAADGFWYSQMLDSYPIGNKRKAALLDALLDLC
ncbi:TetR/AcrR family transcriptional regulator [Paraburkholderia sp. GAS334]|uniref:TetR/AcrR family transcriptional regulator n=1 Tax=Paraburkholderia sp. GAS334 TaxID=3035131 RepID=UPI003D24394E